LYSGSGDSNNDKGIRGGGIDNDNCWAERTDSVLDLASESYSVSDISL